MCKKILFLIICVFSFSGCRVETQSDSSNTNRSMTTKLLSETSFQNVCNGGKVAEAAAYDKTSGTTSPVMVFYQSDVNQSYKNDAKNFPYDWKTQNSDIQLVTCLSVIDRKEVKECPYSIEGKTYKLKLTDVKYKVKIYEALTGVQVAEKVLALNAAKECPEFKTFNKSEFEMTEDPDYTESVSNFINPYITR